MQSPPDVRLPLHRRKKHPPSVVLQSETCLIDLQCACNNYNGSKRCELCMLVHDQNIEVTLKKVHTFHSLTTHSCR
jgi:hypothetical protein